LKKNNANNGIEWGGYSVPSGGYQGQVLTKSSSANGAVAWQSPSSLPEPYGNGGYRDFLFSEGGSWQQDALTDVVYEYSLGS
jgi:hypothetical protein